jgi:hypothetical protein
MNRFIYREKINVRKISHLNYFDNFEFIEIYDVYDKIPKLVKYICYVEKSYFFPAYSFLVNSIKITHLTFGCFYNRSIRGKIPGSVTHLTFGESFNQPIKNNIPTSVTHIHFGYFFNQPIHLPPSIIQISLPKKYDKTITHDPNTKIIFREYD